MAVVFAPLSWWLSSGKQKKELSSNYALDESDTLKLPLAKRNVPSSPSRNIKRKWRSREERKIDREYDIVLVPPDGGCISGSESDDSDYSIGWLEPHGPGFRSDDESLDDSFAVLVPCYGRVRDDSVDDSKTKILSFVGNIAEMYQTGKLHFLSFDKI